MTNEEIIRELENIYNFTLGANSDESECKNAFYIISKKINDLIVRFNKEQND
jgi:hypothetical protein